MYQQQKFLTAATKAQIHRTTSAQKINKKEYEKVKKILSLLLVSLLVMVMFSGCTKVTKENRPFTVGTEAHNGNYNYLYSASAYDRQVCDLVYDRLVVSHDTGISRKNDRVVEKLEISEDGKDYTFTIKKGIKFADGTELKASDIVFTYKALLDPSSTAYFLSERDKFLEGKEYKDGTTKEVKFVEAKDDYTVIFRFNDKMRTNLSACGIGILSEKYYSDWEYGNSEASMKKKFNTPNGSGPYEVSEFKSGEFTTLKLRDDYWAKDITDYKLDTIVIKYTKSDTEIEEIITENVDVLPMIIDKELVERAQKDAKDYVNLIQFKRSAYGYFGFNMDTTDIALRQAIAYCFDREAFIKNQYGDLARSLSIPMSQASSLFDKINAEADPYKKDVDKAKKVLTDAGYTYDGNTLMKDGKKVEVNFLATTGNTVIQKVVPFLKADMATIGITLKDESIQFASMLEKVQKDGDNSWDMMFLANSWTSDEPDTWHSPFHSSNIPQSNMTRYNNPEVDKLLVEGRKFLDLSDPAAIDNYVKIGLALNRDLPQIPLYANTLTVMANKRVKNFKPSTFSDWQWAIEGVTIENQLNFQNKMCYDIKFYVIAHFVYYFFSAILSMFSSLII